MSEASVGVVYICVGEEYARLALLSISHLRHHGYRGAIRVVTDRGSRFGQLDCEVLAAESTHTGFASRHYKTQLDRFAFDTTLFLDADAVPIAPLGHIWRELRFADLCMSLDLHPDVSDLAARCALNAERRHAEFAHMQRLGLLQRPLHSSGVILFRRTAAVEKVFDFWHEEWAHFGHEDQLALVRALARTDCRVHTLSPRWNARQTNFRSVEVAQSAGVRILHLRPRLKSVPDSLLAQARKYRRRSNNRTASRTTYRRRLRVLVYTGSFFPRLGGQEAFVERVVDKLQEHCDVALLAGGNQWLPSDKSIPHFTISPANVGDPRARWRQAAASFRAAVARFEPDIVHFASARAAIYRWALHRKIPSVATVHGNDLTDARPHSLAQDPTPLIVQSLNACKRVFPTGEYTASLAREWGVTAQLSVQTPGCDLEFFHPRPLLAEHVRASFGVPESLPMILTVSRLAARKGHLNAVEAIRRLPFKVCWVVVGQGPCRAQLEQAIEERGMNNDVLLVGSVSDDDLLGLYNACDVFVMTPEQRAELGWLDSEGFGLVFHEAAACGKPVIGSDIAGCRESIVDGRTGFLVPPADPLALSRAIAFVLTNPHEAERLGHCGLETVRGLGGWTRLARSLVCEYASIVPRTAERIGSSRDAAHVN